MIEGSGSGSRSGSILLTSGSGSGRPKNMWIRWIRIRIRIWSILVTVPAYVCRCSWASTQCPLTLQALLSEYMVPAYLTDMATVYTVPAYFAEWLSKYKVPAYLVDMIERLHGAPLTLQIRLSEYVVSVSLADTIKREQGARLPYRYGERVYGALLLRRMVEQVLYMGACLPCRYSWVITWCPSYFADKVERVHSVRLPCRYDWASTWCSLTVSDVLNKIEGR